MGRWLFKIFLIPLLYFISILPFRVLLGISNFFYVLIYYVIGYRKKVVVQNLKNAFPEKSEAEIGQITRQFYLHFCDVIFETLKLLTISEKEFKKRCIMDEASLKMFRDFSDRGQSVVVVLGHCGNWEWIGAVYQLYFKQVLTAAYHPLSNKQFDRFILRLRSRFGAAIVPMNSLFKHLLTFRQQNIPTTIGLIADQTPPPETAYWTMFLNQDTPVFKGPEKLARKFNYPVVYMHVLKVKRGHYRCGITMLAERPAELADGIISEIHTRHLEKNIRQQPYAWLWSHRRWKHKRQVQ